MATSTVRGAGRRKAAALDAKHGPIVGRSKSSPMRKDSIAAPVAAGTLSTRPTKPGKFAAEVEAAGWEVERIRSKDGSKTVRASRDGEELELTWSRGEKFVYPGRYSVGTHTRNVRNASEGRNIVASTKSQNAPNITVRTAEKANGVVVPVVRELTRKLPFDPMSELDDNVVAHLRGRKIIWRNSITGLYESGLVPRAERDVKTRDGFKTVEDKATFISLSKSEETLGRRILSFCDATGAGYRSLFVDALVQVR